MIPAPQVSIVVPVHNTVEYLRKCVESIRNQTLSNIEIILVDNLSNDGSAEVCEEFSRIDPRVKVLHLSSAGASIARNAGIKVASAPYIGFVDSDDYIAPSMYQELLEELIRADAEIAYCNFCYEYENGQVEYPFQDSQNVYLQLPADVIREIMWDKISSSACTKLFKRELFDSLLFPEGFFFEDHMTTYKWVSMCHKIVWVDKTFYFYYQRDASTCHTLNPIKHYHYFLAEYSRLEFVEKYSLFECGELLKIRSRIINVCYSHFCKTLKLTKPKYFREPIEDMKSKFRDLRSLTKDEIDVKQYKRIRTITCFWTIYYFFRFYFKKTKDKRTDVVHESHSRSHG